jgi:sugar phosphate isomerase/epimerase
MKLALKTSCLEGYGLNRIFTFTKEIGFDGVELVISKKNYDTFNADYIKELCESHGLPIIAVQLPQNSGQKQIEEAISFVKKIGTKIIIIPSPRIFNFKYTQWLKEQVPNLREKEQISIAMENAPDDTILGFLPAHAMNSLGELKKFKHICLNTGYSATKKENIIDTYLSIKKCLVHVHLSNIKKTHLGSLPQEGSLPIESFLAKLKQENYKGAISLDIDPRNLHIGKDEEVKKLLTEAKEFCQKYI